MLSALVVLAVVGPVGLLGQDSPGEPPLPAFAYWGVAGALLSILLWVMYSSNRDSQRSLRLLQDRVLNDFLPAIIAGTEQLRQSTEAMRDLASRPQLTDDEFREWRETMRDLGRWLDDQHRGR